MDSFTSAEKVRMVYDFYTIGQERLANELFQDLTEAEQYELLRYAAFEFMIAARC
jgi:hypothetical protein